MSKIPDYTVVPVVVDAAGPGEDGDIVEYEIHYYGTRIGSCYDEDLANQWAAAPDLVMALELALTLIPYSKETKEIRRIKQALANAKGER